MATLTRRNMLWLAAIAAAVSQAARAQTPNPIVGFLTSRAQGADAHLMAAFRQGLSEAGYVEGRDVTIEYRFGNNQYDRLRKLAAELVDRKLDVIFANGVSAAEVKALTSTIPIVFTTGGDPIKSGLLTRLDRPDANATGAMTINIGNAPKRLELLLKLAPGATTVAFLMNPDSPLTNLAEVEAAAAAAGRRLVVLGIRNDAEFEPGFARLVEQHVGGLVVGADPFFVSRRDRLVALAARHRIPASYFGREFTEAGGLMSYGALLSDAYRQAGTYVGRILKGAKPAELPVLQPTRFELVINHKTANALGLEVPGELLRQADQVID